MSGMIHGYARFVLVESRANNGVVVDCYESKLKMVLALVESGTIGEGASPRSFADDAHLEALVAIEQQIILTRRRILVQRVSDQKTG